MYILIFIIIFVKQNREIMARIKDLIIDLQNEFGYDMEFLPEDFNMDEYLAKRAQEIVESEQKELFCEKIKSENN
jgi:hypothetical protein